MRADGVRWRNGHLVIGGVGLVLFILQGQYMARIAGVADLPDAARMMYRSAHIYLLLASVANVVAGYFMTPTVVVRPLQRLIGVVLLLSPVLFIWSFFTESGIASLDRPLARAGLYLLFGAATLLLLDEVYRRVRR
jgi:hypothetical protein